MARSRAYRWTKRVVWCCAACLVVAGSFTAYWSLAPPNRTCASCHEIRAAHEEWAGSSHRDVACGRCHGGGVAGGLHTLWENARRVRGHFDAPDPGAIRLAEEQVVAMQGRCRSCHADAFAGWLAGGHAITYGEVFGNPDADHADPPHEDCLRCHGMYFDGDFAHIATLDTTRGHSVPEALASRPAIPCLACHRVHGPGTPAVTPRAAPAPGAVLSEQSNTTGLYDRNERLFIAAVRLPVLQLQDRDGPVAVADEVSQRICVQCHAPTAGHTAGTGDDRTPRGVHVGLACASCHRPHGQSDAFFCATCHPALSNCGLDVATMNTSFRAADSRNNIHTVACGDCHTDGRTGR